MSEGLRMTPLRLRILAALEQQGEMDLQEIGYEFSSNPRGLRGVFKHPAAATRFGGMLIAPLRRAKLVGIGQERFAYRWKIGITEQGRAALRSHSAGEAP